MKVMLVIVALAAVALAEPPAPNQNTYLPPNQRSQGPSQQYGAPQQYDSFNNGGSQQYNAPSQQYGAPQQHSAPSQQYGAPQQHSAPSQQYGAPQQYNTPSQQYGAPGFGSASNSRNTYAPPTHRVSLRLGSPSGAKNGRNGGYAAARTPSAQYGAPNARSQFTAAPSNQYSSPSFNSAPSSQYGAPSFNSAPSSQYGTPSFNSAPSSQYGAPSFNSAPSSQYGAPAATTAVASFNSAPSSQYGAPSFNSAPSSQYGAPSFNSAPSSQYGAPARSSNNFASKSNGHNGAAAKTPSSQYGAPAFGARNFGTPSTQYGAPNGQAASRSQYTQKSAAPSATYGAPAQGFPSVELGRSSSFNGGARQSAAGQFDSYAASAPQQQYAAPSAQYGAPNARSATTEDPLAEPASYEYTYDVNDSHSGSDFGHKEGRDGEVTHGEYRVLLPDGRTQVVKYEADENGYKPQIEYEEAADSSNNGYPAARNQGGPY